MCRFGNCIRFLISRTLIIALAAGFGAIARAQDRNEFFEAKIRPLLVKHCYSCHSVEQDQFGGLVLDSKPGWEAGGEHGTAVVPGEPDASLLLKAIRGTDPELQMPPEDAGGKLTADQIADVEKWIREGAFDPRLEPAIAEKKKKSWQELYDERRQWWSLQPVRDSQPPQIADAEWNQHSVDRFLRSALLERGIEPSPLADARTLIRRLSFVLTGLPPTIDQVDAFVAAFNADPEKAYNGLVDRLLDSPQYGERFARHWLDVVRFTETHGNEWNYDVPYAYRYRDYVIRAFNNDLPYDKFVREHIAGDLLESPRWNTQERYNESLIGTAFYRFGEVNHDSCVQFGIIGYDIVDNQVDTLTKAFQATTVACARCHDHKMDAVSTRDYHAVLGTLRSSRSVQHTLDDPTINQEPIAKLKSIKSTIRSELAKQWRRELAGLDSSRMLAIWESKKANPINLDDPLYAWMKLAPAFGTGNAEQEWKQLQSEFATEKKNREESFTANYELVADFRSAIPEGWHRDGLGLQEGVAASGDFVVSHEGDAALKRVLPAGLFTCSVSDKLNGALRSPHVPRKRGKISFEVIGGGFSLSRIVFNNCQLNYNHQHSIHHPDWSWITIDYPEKTEQLNAYLELLTYWDNPKFPDPLGTLGKDTENQRLPYNDHAKNPRTWWGIRRIVAHDTPEVPKTDLAFLSSLYEADSPSQQESLAQRYAQIGLQAVEAFSSNQANDQQMRWIDWMMQNGLLSNRRDASPELTSQVDAYREIEIHQLALARTMPGMADEANVLKQPLLVRGDYEKPGELIERGYLEVLNPEKIAVPEFASGRRTIAELIASPTNPLTARVFVNRVWHWIFGAGIVRTTDDFGHLGDLPSDPALLDHLAATFVKEGWSIKKLVRELVLTRAFRASSVPTSSSKEKDPTNLYLAHYNARRGEAEIIRDTMLAVSGRLNPALYGPSVHPYREAADTEKRLYVGPLDGDGRRSLYIKFQLMESPRFLSAFNLPGGKVTQGRRDNSNVPVQSLAMLNDPLVLALADAWAANLVSDGSTSIDDRIDRMFQAGLGRSPSEQEKTRFSAAIDRFAELRSIAPADRLSNQSLWKDAAHAIFNFKEFIYIP